MNLQPRIVEIIDPSFELKAGNRVFSSLEGENPGGSMKDHMVWGELGKLNDEGRLRGRGMAEVSAGSTAVSLAYYCQQFCVRCVLFVPIGTSEDIVNRLKALGAEVHQEDLKKIYEEFEIFLAENPDLLAFNQLFDASKRRHYRSFGKFVAQKIGPLQAIVGGVGTGHSLLGIGEGARCPQIVSAEPAPLLKIPGIRNIELDRYGPNDKLTQNEFTERILIASPVEFSGGLWTSEGIIQVGPSFALVLSAVREYLKGKTHQKVFAVGASAKRMSQSVHLKSA